MEWDCRRIFPLERDTARGKQARSLHMPECNAKLVAGFSPKGSCHLKAISELGYRLTEVLQARV